jgi:hypothetical protein
MNDKAPTSPPATPPRLTAHNSAAARHDLHSSLSPEVAMEKLQRLSLVEESDARTLPELRHPRPTHTMPRSASDSLPSSLLQPAATPSQSRNRSPRANSRQHLRTQSSLSSLGAPPMLRAHSSPAFTSPQFSFPSGGRSSSPLRSPKRVRSPFRVSSDETYTVSSAVSDIESIDEDHELDITPRPTEYRSPSWALGSDGQTSLNLYHNNTFPRRRRPASPLHQVSAIPFVIPTSAPTSTAAFPLFSATKFNETFPSDLTYNRSFSSISSMPSTPTSARSRSPSISSLETIADTPDAEEEAIENEKLDQLRRAADASDSFRRSSLDSGRTPQGFGRGDKRKRWSVCGAEKRSDLNLETIWED